MATLMLPSVRQRQPDRPAAVPRDVARASALKQELTLDIERLIKPYTQDVNEQPPFSTAELIVMAAVCLKEFWSRDSEILAWIGKTFPYYGMKALDHWATLMVECQADPSPVPDFADLFDDYDLPLREYSPASPWFEITTMAARTFLRERLEPPQPGHFRLLDLPAELRLAIFELILTFPRSGINCRREVPNARNKPHTTRISVEVRVDESLRKPASKNPICSWAGWGYGVRLRSFTRLFDLFLVNRQICKEAMPIFYGNNSFHFEGTQSATTFLLRMGPSIKHLSYVRLGLTLEGSDDNRGEMSRFQLGMKALATVNTLKVLAIELQSNEWLRVHRRHPDLVTPRGKKPQSIFHVKGFEELVVAGSKAEKTTIQKPTYDEESDRHDECPDCNEVNSDSGGRRSAVKGVSDKDEERADVVEDECEENSTSRSQSGSSSKAKGLDLPKLSSLLALLSTCKQVYNEAMPCFYRNRLVLDLSSFSLLPKLAASRAEHLSHISLDLSLSRWYPDGEVVEFSSAVRTLADVKFLTKIEIRIASESIKMNKRSRSKMGWYKERTSKKMEEVPYMKKLVALAAKVENLAISGDYPQFRAFVKKERDRLKVEVTASVANAGNGKAAQSKKKTTKTTKTTKKRKESKPVTLATFDNSSPHDASITTAAHSPSSCQPRSVYLHCQNYLNIASLTLAIICKAAVQLECLTQVRSSNKRRSSADFIKSQSTTRVFSKSGRVLDRKHINDSALKPPRRDRPLRQQIKLRVRPPFSFGWMNFSHR
ncbi:hypothetical protein EJ03DRAFT_335818 [Teratosphaeria nubilosa]|uniref:Uncharacterized protein n=1 Tax=Teratosphaeria nubilosa TaxID=161662 RepID=A0A6G1LCL0_9PEZI|nr:hypothetical protein EJ03DRAFT_335818 [Teratosphaeria nubilosa]